MDLEARKISFVQEFLRLQNEEIISGLEKLLRKRKIEMVENSLKPMSMKEYNAEIDQAMNDSKNGRMIKAEDLKTKIQKWG
jgi:precorrin isomerase